MEIDSIKAYERNLCVELSITDAALAERAR
jgi:hypothetical protein